MRSSLVVVVVACAPVALSCGHRAAVSGGGRDVRLTSGSQEGRANEDQKVNQAQLQDELQRFTGQLVDRIAQAAQDATAADPHDAVADEALRLCVRSVASALDIATEPLPEIGVLDMLVFLRLSRRKMLDHWIPNVLGERGRGFVAAFERSEEEISKTVDTILGPERKARLLKGIDEWYTANPELDRVEGVRLTDFSRQAGVVASVRDEEVQGMLASVKSATQSADQALLLAERAFFLANRLPFLLRMQARVATREMTSDALAAVSSADALTKSVKELGPMVATLPPLVAASTTAARESRLLVKDVQPLVPTPEQVDRLEHTLRTANGLVVNTTSLVGDVRATTESSAGPIARVAEKIDATMARALGYLIALGAAWSVMFWGCAVIARRFGRERGPRPAQG
jgi:hypothetical protein